MFHAQLMALHLPIHQHDWVRALLAVQEALLQRYLLAQEYQDQQGVASDWEGQPQEWEVLLHQEVFQDFQVVAFQAVDHPDSQGEEVLLEDHVSLIPQFEILIFTDGRTSWVCTSTRLPGTT